MQPDLRARRICRPMEHRARWIASLATPQFRALASRMSHQAFGHQWPPLPVCRRTSTVGPHRPEPARVIRSPCSQVLLPGVEGVAGTRGSAWAAVYRALRALLVKRIMLRTPHRHGGVCVQLRTANMVAWWLRRQGAVWNGRFAQEQSFTTTQRMSQTDPLLSFPGSWYRRNALISGPSRRKQADSGWHLA
jgi:hypothetical protein